MELNVCFSGIRDKLLEDKIINKGGSISNSVNKMVKYLVVKDINTSSSKIDKANKLKIPVISINDFYKLIDKQD